MLLPRYKIVARVTCDASTILQRRLALKNKVLPRQQQQKNCFIYTRNFASENVPQVLIKRDPNNVLFSHPSHGEISNPDHRVTLQQIVILLSFQWDVGVVEWLVA